MPKSRFIYHTLSVLAVLGAGGIAAPALAQSDAQQATPQDSESDADIVVTAQRREERLIDVPISVSAIGDEKLQTAGVTNVGSIGTVVPNIQVNQTVGASWSPLISIRGLAPSADTSLGRDQPVGIYLDGVPISKSTGAAFDTVDLQRIEVLRGPQGTLYGKNTIGGAVNMVTKKPTGQLGGQIALGIGNYGLTHERIVVDLPELPGGFKIKLGGTARQFGGYFDQLGPSRKFGRYNMASGRADVLWEPVDGLSIGYAYDITDHNGNGTMMAISAPGTITNAPLRPGQTLTPTEIYLRSQYRHIDGRIHTSRPDGIATDYTGKSGFKVHGHAITAAYDVSDNLTLKSITAWRSLKTRSLSDFDGTPTDLLHFVLNNNYKQFTQEVQAIGTFTDFRFTLGGFMMKDEYDVYNPRWNLRFGNERKYDLSDRSGDNKSLAAYGQLTWSPSFLDHNLDITVGGRWTKDTKKTTNLFLSYNTYAGTAAGGLPGGPQNPLSGVFVRDPVTGMPILSNGAPPLTALTDGTSGPYALQPLSAKKSWTKFTPEVNIGYKIDPNWSIYARYATGFKSGGYNDVAASNSAFLTPFEPENLKSWEIGTKGVWMDGLLAANLALYRSTYTDFQAGVFVPSLITTNIINADKATFKGIELEGRLRPVRGLTLSFGYGYLDAKYNKFILPNGTDVTNSYFVPLAPKHNYQLGLNWKADVGEKATLTTDLNWSWRGKQYSSINPDPTTDRIPYGLLDGRITLGDIPFGSSTVEFSVWGKNLLDKEYWNSAINLGLFTIRQWGDPRTFGFETRVKF